MTRNLALLLALTAPGLAVADPSMECSTTEGSQVEIGTCVSDIETRVNATLDVVLGFAMTSAADLDGITERTEATPALKASQAAWLAYRDAQCEYVGSTFGGGSGTGIAITSCRIELTRDRVEELMDYVQ
ncbi:MAG: DUF1311 domain-containing protein [Rhodobacterales bacterium]|jgi:hypothetical protein|nr:DUF1311 domain-containing protein [Rhodobacterales bacterium]